MQFAKVFDIDGTQVLCLLQPRDEDGIPELKMVTYIGGTCVVFGNRLVPLGAEGVDPAEVLTKTRELFDGFGQAEAEQAYKVAQQVISNAMQERAAQAAGSQGSAVGTDPAGASAPGASDGFASKNGIYLRDQDFGVPVLSTALH